MFILLHIASDPVAQVCVCVCAHVCVCVDPDARGVEHGATTSRVSKPSLADQFHGFITHSLKSHSRPFGMREALPHG